MSKQASLFDDTPIEASDTIQSPGPLRTAVAALKIRADKLSPEQKRFNQLLARSEALALKIEATRALADNHRPAHASTLHPLEVERDRLRRDMAVFLDQRVQAKGLTPKQQRIARSIICNMTADFALMGDEVMRALHDAHSQRSLADHEKAIAADTQSFLEDIMGMPLGEQSFASLDEVLRASMAHMRQQAQAHDEARAKRKAKPDAKSARATKAEQQAEEADGALRTIFRQLARALHPDRETNPQERIRKTHLMSEANAAYARRDLLALLQLQLHAELADAGKVANLAREKLAALCLLLKDRVAVLNNELLNLERSLLTEFDLPPYADLNARSLMRHLAEQKQDLQEEVVMMQTDFDLVQDDASLKRWLLQQHRLAAEHDDMFPFA